MKQPATILVLPVLYTILVLPESSSICNTGTDTGKYQYPSIFQNFQVSAILEDTGHCQNMSIADTGRFWLYQYCRYWKILENTGYTSIADTGRIQKIQYCRYWKILVIPVLLTDTGRLGTKLRNVLVHCFFLSCLCVCYERTDSVQGDREKGEEGGGVKGEARWEK